MTTSNNVWVDSIVGAIAGMASVAAGHPADTVKAKLQLDAANQYRNATECFRRTLTQPGGLRALYRGVAPPVCAVAGVNALVFFLYSNASQVLRRVSNTPPDRDLPLAHVFLAGAFTGAVQALAISPLEYAKVHAQLHGTRPFRFLFNTVRAYGLAAVWRGTAVTVAREITYGPYFFVYELIRRSSFAASAQSEATTSFVAGGTAGVAGWLLAYPFDVIKSRIQATGPEQTPVRFRQAWSAYINGANRGKALPVVIGRAFLVNGVQFLCYEVSICLYIACQIISSLYFTRPNKAMLDQWRSKHASSSL
jgi:solute carrier family 25 carnitine/acylcarnitine transporter 20/29